MFSKNKLSQDDNEKTIFIEGYSLSVYSSSSQLQEANIYSNGIMQAVAFVDYRYKGSLMSDDEVRTYIKNNFKFYELNGLPTEDSTGIPINDWVIGDKENEYIHDFGQESTNIDNLPPTNQSGKGVVPIFFKTPKGKQITGKRFHPHILQDGNDNILVDIEVLTPEFRLTANIFSVDASSFRFRMIKDDYGSINTQNINAMWVLEYVFSDETKLWYYYTGGKAFPGIRSKGQALAMPYIQKDDSKCILIDVNRDIMQNSDKNAIRFWNKIDGAVGITDGSLMSGTKSWDGPKLWRGYNGSKGDDIKNDPMKYDANDWQIARESGVAFLQLRHKDTVRVVVTFEQPGTFPIYDQRQTFNEPDHKFQDNCGNIVRLSINWEKKYWDNSDAPFHVNSATIISN